jgi:uncharacterized protein YdbL (DUF1318 family)
MKTSLLRYLFISVMLLGLAPLVSAQNLGEIRARMEKRVAQVDSFKASGVLGENNRGFLEVRSGDDQGVAAAENTDRGVVYAALAKQTGATADAVGKARAKQIFAASSKGVWVQSPSGEWLKK